MRSPYSLEITEICADCQFYAERLFRGFPLTTLQAFEAISATRLYPKGATLFVEGEAPHGIYVLCAGRVKLTAGPSTGKIVTVRLAEVGEVLGLSTTISGDPYPLSAETIESCQADFVERDNFLAFLRAYPEVCFRVVEMLNDNLHAARAQIRSFGKINKATERLAGLLLHWCVERGEETQGGVRLKMQFTHQGIAQMIGASRETVSRLLGELKRQQIISIKGSTLLVHDMAALVAKAGSSATPDCHASTLLPDDSSRNL